MSVRRNPRWLAWLLPLVVLRALLPAGFMLSWTGSDLQIVLCSGTGPARPLVSASVAQDGAHDHHHHHDGGQSKIHENSLCPFAAAGFASVTPPQFVSIQASLAPQERFGPLTELAPRSAPVAAHRIRGPPLT